MARYFVYRSDGIIGRIARYGPPPGVFWGWGDGKWVEMPSLGKILFEITDYEEITEAEAEELIRQKGSEKTGRMERNGLHGGASQQKDESGH